MTIDQIEAGKKYFKSETKMDGRKRVREVTAKKVYVFQVDKKGDRVLASLNGTPPQWFNRGSYSRWKTEDPTITKHKY